MIRRTLRIPAALLAACLLLSLAACGKREEDPQGGVAIYTAETVECAADMERIKGVCAIGDSLYFSGISPVKLANGQTRQDTDRLLRVSPESGEAQPLSTYQPVDGTEAQRKFIGTLTLRPGADETLWQTARISNTRYDLPADFDEERGDWTPYAAENWQGWVLRRLDKGGRELFRFEEEAAALENRLEIGRISDLVMGGDGEIVALGETGLAVLSMEGAVRFTIPMEA